MEPVNLSVQYLEIPIGVDKQNPIFSWQLQSPENESSQSAYQIIFSNSKEKLEKNIGDFWDTEKLESSNSIQMKYEGSTLKSGQKYYWKVRVWDEKNRISNWSETAFFITGILNENDWKAQWIKASDSLQQTMPLFRKEFKIDKKVKQATAFVSGLGYFEFYLNGKKVGDSVLDPAQTNYESYAFYSTFDITDLLAENNCAGVMLGDGWYNQNKAFGIDLSYGNLCCCAKFKLNMKMAKLKLSAPTQLGVGLAGLWFPPMFMQAKPTMHVWKSKIGTSREMSVEIGFLLN
jgi:alpha-L-rhamnosidase